MLGTVDIKVRPLKLAYLIDPNSPEQVREAIKISSTLWGGSYNPIIPLYKKMPKTWREGPIKAPEPKKVILGYIDSFDPDILVQFSKEIPAFVKDTGLKIISPNEIWQQHGVYGSPFKAHFGIGIFDVFNEIFEIHFKYKPKYPVKVIIPKIPNKYPLLWASIFGEFPDKTLDALKKNYYKPLDIKEVDIDLSSVGDLFHGDNIFPRRATQGNLEHFRHSGFRREAAVFYFDASKHLDIVDFWNLRALGRFVFPLPKQLRDNQSLKNEMIKFIKANRREWKHQPGVFDMVSIIRGRNCNMDDMSKFFASSVKINDPKDTSNYGYFSLQHWYPRIWDDGEGKIYDGADPQDTYEQQTSIDVTDMEKFRVHFNPIFPKFVQDKSIDSEPCCANEISFRFYSSHEYMAEVLPRSTGEKFIRAISSQGSFRNEWRVGRNGLVYLVKDTLKEYWDIPTSEKTFFAWLEDQGWSVKLSNSGVLAKQIYKKLDGHIATLGNESLIKILDHMNGGKNLYKDEPTTNIELEEGRDMSVDKVKAQLKSRHGRSDEELHEYLLSKGIFRLGLKIECPDCFRKSWYRLDDVKDFCTCPKCLHSFSAIGNVHLSTWSYKTYGPFSVPQHADGAFSVLLGVNFFNEHSLIGIRFSPVFSFNATDSEDKKLEADFAGFWEQRSGRSSDSNGILFAECKTFGDFENKDFDRMAGLAKKFPGAVIVFCTMKKELTPDEIKSITKIAKAGRKYWKNNRPINPVLILTHTELTGFPSVPHCWPEPWKKRFDHMSGLLPTCDATQQIYLNLPSWEEEWHKKWDKKHQKRIAKNKTAQN
jgi:hypothetical protein